MRLSRSPLHVLVGAILVLALCSFAHHAAYAERTDERERRELVLAPGEQRIIPGEGVDAISTGVPGVADVRVTDDQKQVLVVGMAPGSTSLLLMMKNGTRIEYSVTVSRVRLRRNIRIDFYFVQLSRHRGLQLGVLWPGSLGATASGTAIISQAGQLTATANIVSQVIPRLDFARTRGWAKVIDQARVVMANGEEGSYSSGGEVNVKLATGFAANLQKISFGTNVTARLSYDDVTGRIEGRLKAEVSRLNSSSVDGIPGRSVLQVATTVNLELGQSIALAGLFSDDQTDQRTGLPLLSEIPIIGYLFGGANLSHERTENVVLMVPTLVEAIALEQRDRVGEAFAIYRQFEGEMEERRDLGRLPDDAVPATTVRTQTAVPPQNQRKGGGR